MEFINKTLDRVNISNKAGETGKMDKGKVHIQIQSKHATG